MPILQRALIAAMVVAFAGTSCTPDEPAATSQPGPAIVGREAREAAPGQLVFSHCTDQHHCELATSEPDGGSFRLLTRNDFWALKPEWSPTGEWIAFQRDGGDGQGIYVIRPSGEGLRRVAETTDDIKAFYPCWVDEDTVGFTYGDHFATVSLDDPVIDEHRIAYTADCGPDGRTIAFPRSVHKQVSGHELVVDQLVVGADMDRRSGTVVAQAQLEFSEPALSPDGRWVAFCAQEHAYGTGSWVGLARADGTGRWRRLRSMSCEDVTWKPAGDELVVSSCHPDCYTVVDVGSGLARRVNVGFPIDHVDWRSRA